MNDWLSFLLLGSGVIGLGIIFIMNRHTRIFMKNKKTNQLQERINQILYFDTPADSLMEEAADFTPKQLIQYFGSLFSQFRTQAGLLNKLHDLFKRLRLDEAIIEAYNTASNEEKLSILEECKSLPVPDITQFLVSVLYKSSSEWITIKIGEALAAHKTIDALPIFLIKSVQISHAFDEGVASVIRSFQGDFPGFFLDKQDPRLRDFQTKIEARYLSFLESPEQKIMIAGLYVLGSLGLESSIPRILQAMKTPAGRLNLHVACTALKKFSQDRFLSSLAIWILSTEDWTGDEIQDLISVFSRFYPAGEELIRNLQYHPQLIVKVSSEAAIRQIGG